MTRSSTALQGALDLTEAEYRKLVAHLNHARRRDRQRRLLLIRIEAALPNGGLVDMTGDSTVEHILPKGSHPWWNERYPDPRRRGEVCNLLGNLTLITREQQGLADTAPFPDKRRVYFETPGAPIWQMTEMLRSVPEWTYEAIERRTYEMISHLLNDWGLFQNDW